MKIIYKLTQILFIFAVLAYGSLLPSYAEENSGIVLEPSYTQANMHPSEKKTFQFTITNNEQSQFQIHVNVIDAKTNNSQINIPEDYNETNYPQTEKFNISTTIEKADINANESSNIQIEIQVPQDAKPGDYYLLVVFELTNEKSTMQLNLGAPTILHIDKEKVKKELQIIQFISTQNIFFTPTIRLNTQIKNNSDIVIRPIGYIEFYDPQGKKLKFTQQINSNAQYLLSQDTLTEEIKWEYLNNKTFPAIGKYTAKLVVQDEYKDINPVIKTIQFWVIPWQYIAIFAAIVVSILGMIKIKQIKKNTKKRKSQKTSSNLKRNVKKPKNKQPPKWYIGKFYGLFKTI